MSESEEKPEAIAVPNGSIKIRVELKKVFALFIKRDATIKGYLVPRRKVKAP